MTTASKITLIRVAFIPVFMLFMYLSGGQTGLWMWIALAVFIVASITDYIDGEIARKYNQISDFGKFLDPLADKCMILGGFIGLLAVANVRGELYTKILAWSFFLILLRELAVTSMRLVVSDAGNIVIAANWMGKVKTVLQTVTMVVLILEPVLMMYADTNNIVSYVFLAATVVLTMWSGINYFVAYWPYLDPSK